MLCMTGATIFLVNWQSYNIHFSHCVLLNFKCFRHRDFLCKKFSLVCFSSFDFDVLVAGTEALFADLGHFSYRSIQVIFRCTIIVRFIHEYKEKRYK